MAILLGGRALELAEPDMVDGPDRKLEKPLSELAELLGRAGREEAAAPIAARVVLDAPARQGLGHLASGLLGRGDERDRPPEDALEDRPDEGIVRATEDHRVAPRFLQRRRALANRVEKALGRGRA